ncbi:MAG: 6-phosphogluconolactonase [Gammaproteobacteria bacterium WSBS_2016_MAG_OTU1]
MARDCLISVSLLNLHVYEARTEQMAAAAGYLASALKQNCDAHGAATVALAGGNTPADAYRILATHPLDWSAITITPTDERCVPPTCERSNIRMLRQTLGEDKHIETLVEGQAPLTPDVVLLGAGDDGHIASLFPDIPKADKYISRVQPKNQPEERLTLPMQTLVAAENLLLLICGENKFRLLAQTNPDLPLCQLLREREHTTVYYAN